MSNWSMRLQAVYLLSCWLLSPIIFSPIICGIARCEDDQEILQRSTNSVWYDSAQGTIEPANASNKNLDVSDRHESITSTDKSYNWSWLEWFSLNLQEVFSWIFASWRIVLIVFLLMFLFLMIYFVGKYTDFGSQYWPGRKRLTQTILERESVKIQDLPFEIEQSALGLLGQAEKYRAAQDYSRAVIYLYSHVLVELDEARCIRLAKGKTNRMYLRELKEREFLRSFASQLVLAFELTFFGKHALDARSFESIWKQLGTFELELKRIGATPKAPDTLPTVFGGVS